MSSTKQTTATKKKAMIICTTLLLSAFASAPAFAKSCKNVHLEVKNMTGQTVKIYDLDYWDSESERWRSEPVANEDIRHNRTWQANRNLGRINGQDTQIKVKYKVKVKKWNRLLKRWKWKTVKKTYKSSSKKCTRDAEFLMTLR